MIEEQEKEAKGVLEISDKEITSELLKESYRSSIKKVKDDPKKVEEVNNARLTLVELYPNLGGGLMEINPTTGLAIENDLEYQFSVSYKDETTEVLAKDLESLLKESGEGLNLKEGSFEVKHINS